MLRTNCGNEELVVSYFEKIFPEVKIIYPRRRINWRKNGRVINLVRPLFEGYLFVSAEREKIKELYHLLRAYKSNIARLLFSAGSLVPIFDEEKQLIQKLIGSKEIVEVSEVQRINNQLQVVKGPLLGLEHTIKKISRNWHITVEIPVFEEKRRVELEGVLINHHLDYKS